jgi:hypothetical protein
MPESVHQLVVVSLNDPHRAIDGWIKGLNSS